MTRFQNMIQATSSFQLAAPLCAAVLAVGCGGDAAPGMASDMGATNRESFDSPRDEGTGDTDRSAQGHRVVGYLPTYRFADSPPLHLDTLTHLNIAFAVPNAQGDIDFPNLQPRQIENLVTDAHAANVKVLAALAGGDGEATRLRLGEGVESYVESVLALVEKYGLDGVDVDIEGTAIEPQTYEPLMLELARGLRELPGSKLLTAAVAAERRENYRALGTVDFLNVMSYDHCAQSDHECDHATLAQAQIDLDYWSTFAQPDQSGVTRTIGAENVVLGVPFYGRCWGEACPERELRNDGSRAPTSGLTYSSIVRYCESGPFVGCSPSADVLTDGKGQQGYYVSLNSPTTIEKKAEQAKRYGGIMIWELGQDTADGALFAGIGRAFPKPAGPASGEDLGRASR